MNFNGQRYCTSATDGKQELTGTIFNLLGGLRGDGYLPSVYKDASFGNELTSYGIFYLHVATMIHMLSLLEV